MSVRARISGSAAAAVLIAGSTLGGAAVASAEEGGSSGSSGALSSSALGGLGDAVGDLAVAAKALNGPVTVTPNRTGGPTVKYTNKGTAAEQCLGFSAPYSTIVERDLDTDIDTSDLDVAIVLLGEIEAGGDVSLLLSDENGTPVSEADDPDSPEDIGMNLIPLVYPDIPGMPAARSVVVQPGGTITWTAGTPDTPAVAAIMCLADAEGAAMVTNFGIDKQVVADQINAKIPGGSLDVVSSGSISGGSVSAGVGMLGSLADSDED